MTNSKVFRRKIGRAISQLAYDIRYGYPRLGIPMARILDVAGIALGDRIKIQDLAVPNVTPGWKLCDITNREQFKPVSPVGWRLAKSSPHLSNAELLANFFSGVELASYGQRVLTVSDATVTPGMSLITSESTSLLPESLDRIPGADFTYDPHPLSVTSPWVWPRGFRSRYLDILGIYSKEQQDDLFLASKAAGPVGRPRTYFSEAISLFDSLDSHFGHWFFDILPRLAACDHIPAEIPILLSEQTPENVVAAVGVARPRAPILQIPLLQRVRVAQLHVPLEGGALWYRKSSEDCSVYKTKVRPALIDVPNVVRMGQRIAGSQPYRQRSRFSKAPILWLLRDHSPNNQFADERQVVTKLQATFQVEASYLENCPLPSVPNLLSGRKLIIVPDGSVTANLTLLPEPTRILLIVDHVYPMYELGVLPLLARAGHEVFTLATEGDRILRDDKDFDWLAALLRNLN